MEVLVLLVAAMLLLSMATHGSGVNTSMSSWWTFTGLTWNSQRTIRMSHDLAVAMQRLRTVLGTGNITHSGVYRSKYWRKRQDGTEIRELPYTGHYFGDAIDLKTWGSHGYIEICNAARSCGMHVVQEDALRIAHCEVNYPHMEL